MLLTHLPLIAYFMATPLPCLCLPFGIIALLGTAFWIWMLIDAITNEPSEGNDKIIWLLVILFTHLLGAILYFAIRRPERIRKFGK